MSASRKEDENPDVNESFLNHESSQNVSARKKKKKIYIGIIVLVLIIVITVTVILIAMSRDETECKGCNSGDSDKVNAEKGAVVSDHEVCSQIGRDILMKGGSAVDAAIATLVCNGVFTPHSMGIGGGCFMVIYDKKQNKSIFIDGRESGPSGQTEDDFYKTLKPQSAAFYSKDNAIRVGVPGELKAYKEAHTMYGQLPWRALFQPTLDIMQKGMALRNATYKAMVMMNMRLKQLKMSLANFTTLCEMFCANTTTGEPKNAGDIYYSPKLRKTLMGIAEQGPEYLYNGSITQTIVEELQAKGSKIALQDFTSGYNLISGPSLKVDYGEYSMYTIGRATGGPVVAEILNILEGYNLTKTNVASCQARAETYHKMIEATKFALVDKQRLEDPDFGQNVEKHIKKMVSKDFAKRIRARITPMTHDDSYYSSLEEFSKTDDMGTSHVSVLSPDGDAVSVTSTINWYFGSMEMSESTGIIWNNEMDDFSGGNKGPYNRFAPGKRPRSSMVPVILVDKHGNVRFVVGAAGGGRITTSVAQITAKMLWLADSLKKVVEEERFHVLYNERVSLELEATFGNDEESRCVKEELLKKNHTIKAHTLSYMSVVESIYVHKNGTVEAVPDERKLHRPM